MLGEDRGRVESCGDIITGFLVLVVERISIIYIHHQVIVHLLQKLMLCQFLVGVREDRFELLGLLCLLFSSSLNYHFSYTSIIGQKNFCLVTVVVSGGFIHDGFHD